MSQLCTVFALWVGFPALLGLTERNPALSMSLPCGTDMIRECPVLLTAGWAPSVPRAYRTMDLAQKNSGKGIGPKRKLNKGGKVADGRCLRAFRMLTAHVGRLPASR